MNLLLTGTAGFIGNALALSLLADGHSVVGVDNLNDYYDPALKRARLRRLPRSYVHHYADITEPGALPDGEYDAVIHLAGQAGVRHSIENPYAYIDANVTGFQRVLDFCDRNQVPRLLYASSSSVYGHDAQSPYSEVQRTDTPASLYAVTKKANEQMAHAYQRLHGLATVGMRFFTVYGPFGRPDMAPFKFVDRISRGLPIDLYNGGDHWRDFTHVDDIVAGVKLLLSAQDVQPVYNIASGRPVHLGEFVAAIEARLGKQATVRMMPMQPGDVLSTHADISRLAALGYSPAMPLEDGLNSLVDWYQEFYG